MTEEEDNWDEDLEVDAVANFIKRLSNLILFSKFLFPILNFSKCVLHDGKN